MTPEEIAALYEDSMSANANRQLVEDIREAVKEEYDRAEKYRSDLKDLVSELWKGTTGIHTWKDTLRRAGSIGTPPATEPPSPSPGPSDGG